MFYAALCWIAAMIIFLIVEANTAALVSVWFAGGALAAAIAALCGGPVWLQTVLFFAVSAILLACLRPLSKRLTATKITPTNIDALIGAQGYVTADIDNLTAQGTVKLGAMEWTARSAGGQNIPAGTLVQVERIEGVKAFVTPVNT